MKKIILYFGLAVALSGLFNFGKTALADDGADQADGRIWIFNYVIPTDETTVDVKFNDWVNNSSGIRPGSSIQFYSAQSLNAPNESNVITVNAATSYTSKLNLIHSRNSNDVHIIVQAFEIISPSISTGVSPEIEFIDASGKSTTVKTTNNTTPNPTPQPIPTDTTAPAITLLGDPTVNLTVGDIYTDAGVTALDDVDGNITARVVTVNPVDINIVGTYTVAYDVADTAGNKATEVTRTVIVTPPAPVVSPQPITADAIAPVITLLGDPTISLVIGDTYTDAGVTASDNVDGDITSKVIIVNPVDVSTAGTYIVTYDVADTAGNKAVEVTRTVVVTDPTPKSTVDNTTPTIDLPSSSVTNPSMEDDVTAGQ
jgi:hypothetical protein